MIAFEEVHIVMRENSFQAKLKKEILLRFPGSMVIKTDPVSTQGLPDLLILYKDKWASLECKKSEKDYKHHQQPNQDYYVEKMNQMSFARFIYPENKEVILNELQQAFESCR